MTRSAPRRVVSNGNVTDNVIQITGTGITDLAFTDANGDPLDGDSSGLFTTDGERSFFSRTR